MTSTTETYKQVANHCSEYTPKSSTTNYSNSNATNCSNSSATNCSNDCNCERTCLTCDHFSSENLCDLDICNKIIRDHNLA